MFTAKPAASTGATATATSSAGSRRVLRENAGEHVQGRAGPELRHHVPTPVNGEELEIVREVHHVHKLDAPSGTAITLKQAAMTGGLSKGTPIRSERQGEVVGLHALAWESAHDSFVLQHEAKSRAGFAEGAVLALRWTWRQHQLGQHGLYTMNDLFTP